MLEMIYNEINFFARLKKKKPTFTINDKRFQIRHMERKKIQVKIKQMQQIEIYDI